MRTYRGIICVFCVLISFACRKVTEPDTKNVTWDSISTFAFQLQYLSVSAIANSSYDMVIIDYSTAGDDSGQFTREQVTTMKANGKKLVAYISIGEAENYRFFWNSAWDANNDGVPDAGAPAWLGPGNPDWPGSYKVRFWMAEWKTIVYAYLDRIIDSGFDGVYLDIIDAYEYWTTQPNVDREMVTFVQEIAAYCRTQSGNPDFGIFPQNGEGLSVYNDYIAVTTGIGREDTWYNGNTPNSSDHIYYVCLNLDRFKNAEKLVLCTDYTTNASAKADFYAKAHAKGYIPFATQRELDILP